MTRRELAKFLTLGSGLLAGANVLIAFIGLTGQRAGPPRPADRRRRRRRARERRCCSATRPTTTRAFWCATRRDVSHAFSQVCTHLSCAVVHQPDDERAGCPCHKGSFSDARRAAAGRPADAAAAAHP